MLAMVRGVVRGGTIIPETAISVPEGTQVEISFLLPDVPAELQEEFAAWDRASDDAWRLIERLDG